MALSRLFRVGLGLLLTLSVFTEAQVKVCNVRSGSCGTEQRVTYTLDPYQTYYENLLIYILPNESTNIKLSFNQPGPNFSLDSNVEGILHLGTEYAFQLHKVSTGLTNPSEWRLHSISPVMIRANSSYEKYILSLISEGTHQITVSADGKSFTLKKGPSSLRFNLDQNQVVTQEVTSNVGSNQPAIANLGLEYVSGGPYKIEVQSYTIDGVSQSVAQQLADDVRISIHAESLAQKSLNIDLTGRSSNQFHIGSFKTVETPTSYILSDFGSIGVRALDATGKVVVKSLTSLYPTEQIVYGILLRLNTIVLSKYDSSLSLTSVSGQKITAKALPSVVVPNQSLETINGQLNLYSYQPGYLELVQQTRDGQTHKYKIFTAVNEPQRNVLLVKKESSATNFDNINQLILGASHIQYNYGNKILTIKNQAGAIQSVGLSNIYEYANPKKVYRYKQGSYWLKGQPAELIPGTGVYRGNIDLSVYETKTGVIVANFKINDSFQYSFEFQPRDGWVLIKVAGNYGRSQLPSGATAQALVALEALLGKVTQISHDFDDIQFIDNYANDRITFTRDRNAESVVIDKTYPEFMVSQTTSGSASIVPVQSAGSQATFDIPLFKETQTELFDVSLDTEKFPDSLRLNLESAIDKRSIELDLTYAGSIPPTYQIQKVEFSPQDLVAVPQKYANPAQSKILNILNDPEVLILPSNPKNGAKDSIIIKNAYGSAQFFADRPVFEENLVPSLDVGKSVQYSLQVDSIVINGYTTAQLSQLKRDIQIPIIIKINKVNEGQVVVTYNILNNNRLNVHYQPHDGWVLEKNGAMTMDLPLASSGITMDAAKKVDELIQSVQQFSFDSNGNIQFISEYGASRVSFKAVPSMKQTQARPKFTQVAITESTGKIDEYKLPGQYSCTINENYVGYFRVKCITPRTSFVYKFYYNEVTKEIIKIIEENFANGGKVLEFTNLGNDYKVSIANDVIYLYTPSAEIHLVAFDKNINFNYGNSDDREIIVVSLPAYKPNYGVTSPIQRKLQQGFPIIAPLPIPAYNPYGIYVLNRESLLDAVKSNPALQSLVQVVPDNWIVSVAEVSGVEYDVTFNINNDILKYRIAVDPHTSIVRNTRLLVSTIAPTSQESGNVVASFIDDMLKEFELTPHGLVISVKKGVGTHSPTLVFKKRTVAKYDILPDTFFVNGQFSRLYDGTAPYPFYVSMSQHHEGTIHVALHGKQTFTWIYKMQHSDGWILERQFLGAYIPTNAVVAPYDYNTSADEKLADIFHRLQQIAFEADGQIQFITDYGNTRVSFFNVLEGFKGFKDIPSKHLGRKTLVPETYFHNGEFESLSLPSYPISIDVLQYSLGLITILFEGYKKTRILYEYQNHDGWVAFLDVLYNEFTRADVVSHPTDANLLAILANTEQIAFEKDGRLQFIRDNGATRVTFV